MRPGLAGGGVPDRVFPKNTLQFSTPPNTPPVLGKNPPPPPPPPTRSETYL